MDATWVAPQLLWRQTPTHQASPTCRVSQRHRHRHEMEGKPQEPIDGRCRATQNQHVSRAWPYQCTSADCPAALQDAVLARTGLSDTHHHTITNCTLEQPMCSIGNLGVDKYQVPAPSQLSVSTLHLHHIAPSNDNYQLGITAVFPPIPFPMGCFASKPNPEHADEKLARDHEAKKEWAQAEAIYRQILDKRIARMPNFHPDYVVIMQRLQNVLLAQDPKSKEAEEIEKKVSSRIGLSIPLPRRRRGNGENTETKFRGYLRQVHPWRKHFAKANEDAGKTRRHYAALLGRGWQLREVLGWRSDEP